MTAGRAGTEDEWEEEARLAEEHREPSQAVWAAYWGFDSCGPGGILDRLYTALRIPQKSWGGLKRLPEVGGISYERRHSYMHLVSNFLQVCVSFEHGLLALSLLTKAEPAPKLLIPAGPSHPYGQNIPRPITVIVHCIRLWAREALHGG